ncbi:MAG: F0F1 ATP synthase subunit A [Candidatus Binatia bacterium]
MELEPHVVFTVLGLPVTVTVVATWALVGVLSGLGVVAGANLQTHPARWQAVVQYGFQALQRMLQEVMGKNAEPYVPLVATIAIFILVANLMSALPFVEAPTADINTPFALATIVFFSVHYYGVLELGAREYIKKFTQPVFILLPINVLGNITRTLSLAIRLFGNMISHQIIVAVLLVILPLVVPVLLELFGLFVGILQAYIFTLLTIVYIGGAVRAGGEL